MAGVLAGWGGQGGGNWIGIGVVWCGLGGFGTQDSGLRRDMERERRIQELSCNELLDLGDR